MTQEYIGTKQVTAWPQDKDGKHGYAVKYADGYTSWSPKETFEEAYIGIGHVSHLPPHQQRVIGEKAVLDDKIAKLSAFIGSFREPNSRFAALSEPERMRMYAQRVAMISYSNTLAERIAAF